MSGKDPRGLVGETLRAMFARSDDPYRGADLTTSRRVAAALIGFSALLSIVFLPLDPPTAELEGGGWALAAALILRSLAGRTGSWCAR